ncbi:hypothetical protein [Streptomyces sp. NPDC088812]|uniref:hypothetical protein n=1 Tax=Streptomyces sp. NPDC088812 TaxID=3365905 RepID=UPI0038285745
MLPLPAVPVDRRFLLTAVLPTLTLSGGLLLLWGYAHGLADTLAGWGRLDAGTRWLRCAGFAVAVGLLSLLTSAVQPRLLALFSGEWPTRVGRALAGWRGGAHRARLRELAVQAGSGSADHVGRVRRALREVYPSPALPDEVLPTRLGNVLRHAEQYPRRQYGMDPVVVWPRLQPLVAEPSLVSLAAARTNLVLLITLSSAGAVFAVASAVVLLGWGGPVRSLTVCLLAGLGVAVLAQRAAVSAAAHYSLHLKVAFDLYRHTLLQQLGLEPPDALDAEIALWERLVRFWDAGIPYDLPEEAP